MRRLGYVALLFLFAGSTVRAQDFLDRLGEALTVSALDGDVRARLSGTVDLEYYFIELPAPGLIEARARPRP
jgi:hypothetical protein